MKILRNPLFSLAFMLVFAQTCVKDSKEDNTDEEQSYIDSMYGDREEIIRADWNKFMSLSSSVVAVSESNLRSLRIKMQNSPSSDEKIRLQNVHQRAESQLSALKESREKRDLQYREAQKRGQNTVGESNTEFKTGWLEQMVELNNMLEEAIEK